MEGLAQWLLDNIRDLLVSFAVALASLIVLLWIRRLAMRWINQISQVPAWSGVASLFDAIRLASFLWTIFLSIYLAVLVSPVQEPWKSNVANIALSLFILGTGVAATRFTRRLFLLIGHRYRMRRQTIEIASAVPIAALLVIAALGVLQLWGAPTAPLLLTAGILSMLALVAVRSLLPTIMASLQVTAISGVKPGDYVKVDTGEEGTVENVSWRDLAIRSSDGNQILIPYTKLMRTTLTNYGKPLKKALEPFHFYARSHLQELTGLEAHNIQSLVDCLSEVPDSSIYYHTHLYLEEHQYLIPTPANAFSEWVGAAVGNRALAERLAAADVVEMMDMGAIRERLIGAIRETIDVEGKGRDVLNGEEFHFLKATTFITSTPYQADDLREMIAALRRVPLNSLYFHMFESRLLSGGRTANDISRWLRESLDEPDLARDVDRFNPYDFTLEGLRSSLIRLIETRLG